MFRTQYRAVVLIFCIVMTLFLCAGKGFCAGTVDFVLEPLDSPTSMSEGTRFSLGIVMNADASTKYNAVTASLRFDPSVLRVLSFEKNGGTPLQLQGRKIVSNDIGVALIDLGGLSGAYAQGSSLIAVLSLMAVASGDTNVSFDSDSMVAWTQNGSTTDVTGSKDLLPISVVSSDAVVGDGNALDLLCTPNSCDIFSSRTFTVDISVAKNGDPDYAQYVDGVACHLNYDPSCLAVVGTPVIAQSPLKQVFRNDVSRPGCIDIVLGATPGTIPPKTPFPVATVTLRALPDAAGLTHLWFVREENRVTDIAVNGWSVLREARRSDYFINPLLGLIRGKVSLAGRAAAKVPLTVNLSRCASPDVGLSDATIVTDAAGGFEILLKWSGPFDVAVRKAFGTNVWKHAVPGLVLATPPVVDFGVLPEGDADQNGMINIMDFSIFVMSFNKKKTDNGFDPRADFNGDGIVNIADFSLLSAGFGKKNAASASSVEEKSPSKASGGCMVPGGEGALPFIVVLLSVPMLSRYFGKRR